jgi:UDPglucose 6-dehydrogenase
MHMKIAVVGSGYVGLVAAACFAEIGHDVICADNDVQKIAALRNGIVPIHEEFLPELIQRHSGSRLSFTASTAEAIRVSQVVFIAVGTPTTQCGAADLSYVESVAREIAKAMNGFKLVVEKSTVPVYTNECVQRAMVLNGARENEFEVVSNPEFLREGTAVTDFLYPDRIVVGCGSARAAEMMRHIYEPMLSGVYYDEPGAIPRPEDAVAETQLIQTSARSAELIKHASNAFLAMKISFINAVANVCELVGADIEEVSKGVGADTRIGSKFLRAGLGYGGSCFPKDVSAFKTVAKECGYEFRLLDEVTKINENQRQAFLRKVRTALWTLKGKRLAVLGLSFKGGTDDIRESPAVAIIRDLLAQECEVIAFDPAAMERAQAELQFRNLSFAQDPYTAAYKADALLILTDWEDFSNLDLAQMRTLLRYPILLDGRNLYDPQEVAAQGLTYYSVGRAPVITNPEKEPAREVPLHLSNGNGHYSSNGLSSNGHSGENGHNGRPAVIAKAAKASGNGSSINGASNGNGNGNGNAHHGNDHNGNGHNGNGSKAGPTRH